MTLWLAGGAMLLLAIMAVTRPAGRPTLARAGGGARLSMAEARAINAARPFADAPLHAAAAYRFAGTPAAREQAVRCLATVALYEAGGDANGRRAVMQVVLNRARSPGFPKTICGVVYEGAYRATGCQFSFACDGSAQRRPERMGWDKARREARAALSGAVFAPVGTATHYHTDWVVPYWSDTLEKIAQVRTHIFYRRPAPPAHHAQAPAAGPRAERS